MEFPNKEDKKKILDGTFFLPDTPIVKVDNLTDNTSTIPTTQKPKIKWYDHLFFYGNLLLVIVVYVFAKYINLDWLSDIGAMSAGMIVGIKIEETINNHTNRIGYKNSLLKLKTMQPTKNQEIKYYLTEGMTEIIPLSLKDWRDESVDMTDTSINEWATKLQQSKSRIKVSQELQDKLSELPFTDWCEIHETMFSIEYSVLEGEVTLMAYIKANISESAHSASFSLEVVGNILQRIEMKSYQHEEWEEMREINTLVRKAIHSLKPTKS